MNLEPLREGMKCFDDEMPNLGEGIITIIEDNMVEVHYKDVEEVVEYSLNEANKHLNLLL